MKPLIIPCQLENKGTFSNPLMRTTYLTSHRKNIRELTFLQTMTFKSGAAFLSILTLLSFLIRSISCNTESSLFKKLLKVTRKDYNHGVTRKPIYVQGRQEEKKVEEDDYTQNNIDFYDELRSDLRNNLKELLKYESTKNKNREYATQRKEEAEEETEEEVEEEEKWKDEKMLRSQLRMRLKYDLKSLLSRGKKKTETRQIKYPQKHSYEYLEMRDIIESGKNAYKIAEAGRIHQPLKNNYEIVKIEQTAEVEKEAKKAKARTQLINPFNFEDIIAKEWKELDDIDNRAWSHITSSCQIALEYGLHSDPNRCSKIDIWKNKHEAFSHMRDVKNIIDKRRLHNFVSRLRKLKGDKKYEESWKEENEKWEVIKYLKKESDENWNKNLKESWAHWFRTEIPKANFDVII